MALSKLEQTLKDAGLPVIDIEDIANENLKRRLEHSRINGDSRPDAIFYDDSFEGVYKSYRTKLSGEVEKHIEACAHKNILASENLQDVRNNLDELGIDLSLLIVSHSFYDKESMHNCEPFKKRAVDMELALRAKVVTSLQEKYGCSLELTSSVDNGTVVLTYTLVK